MVIHNGDTLVAVCSYVIERCEQPIFRCLLLGLGFQRGLDFLLENWPLLVVIVGLLMVIGAFLRGRGVGRGKAQQDG